MLFFENSSARWNKRCEMMSLINTVIKMFLIFLFLEEFITLSGFLSLHERWFASHALTSIIQSLSLSQKNIINKSPLLMLSSASRPTDISVNFVFCSSTFKSRHGLTIGSSRLLVGWMSAQTNNPREPLPSSWREWTDPLASHARACESLCSQP